MQEASQSSCGPRPIRVRGWKWSQDEWDERKAAEAETARAKIKREDEADACEEWVRKQDKKRKATIVGRDPPSSDEERPSNAKLKTIC